MPTYEYRCNKCKDVVEIVHSIKESPILICENCPESVMERLISHNIGGFVIKGESPSKVIKEMGVRRKKNADLGVRQLERYGSGPSVAPNVGGEEVGSWSEAAKLAKSKGLRSETYEPMIRKEKKISKVSGMNDVAWKKAKTEKGLI
jgi:putative FmdB family regulatory protein